MNATEQFMELVDCQPHDVRDIPQWRVGLTVEDHMRFSTRENVTREQAGEFIMPFGKYEGKKLSEIPDSYLAWGAKNLSGAAGELMARLGPFRDEPRRAKKHSRGKHIRRKF